MTQANSNSLRAWVKLLSDGTSLDISREIEKTDFMEVHRVLGEWDVIVRVLHRDFEELKSITDKLRRTRGVYDSDTHIMQIPSPKLISPSSTYAKLHCFTFVKVFPGTEEAVQGAFVKLSDVILADVIYGDYDLIVETMTSSPPHLAELLRKAREGGNILRTNTMVAFT